MMLDELPTIKSCQSFLMPRNGPEAERPPGARPSGARPGGDSYSTEAEAMLSQPVTKTFLRTSEPRAAQWISKALGEIELERLKQSVNHNKVFGGYRIKSHNFSLDRQVEPLALPSEIMGLNYSAHLN